MAVASCPVCATENMFGDDRFWTCFSCGSMARRIRCENCKALNFIAVDAMAFTCNACGSQRTLTNPRPAPARAVRGVSPSAPANATAASRGPSKPVRDVGPAIHAGGVFYLVLSTLGALAIANDQARGVTVFGASSFDWGAFIAVFFAAELVVLAVSALILGLGQALMDLRAVRDALERPARVDR